jgi:tRNA (guanine37-N1)-methyltransferase
VDIDVITLFPAMFDGPFEESIVHRARERGILSLRLIHLRDFGLGRHKLVDDTPYGGGPGMVLRPEPLAAAIEAVRRADSRVVLMTPQGRLLRQPIVRELALAPHLVLICGHYEGVDDRVLTLVDDELSIGDYVLTGGELAAMVVVDAVTRLLPGALGAAASAEQESHGATGLLDWPHYTKPREFNGLTVPDVLLSGNHAAIARWRAEQARERTAQRRPELLPPPEPAAPERPRRGRGGRTAAALPDPIASDVDSTSADTRSADATGAEATTAMQNVADATTVHAANTESAAADALVMRALLDAPRTRPCVVSSDAADDGCGSLAASPYSDAEPSAPPPHAPRRASDTAGSEHVPRPKAD